ncbi:unnamed protein product [Mytilus coruscus]|uniref:Uncharacterized protein n=1 Tax=Mytilus coruscus TaxID=42192 RepID=A0A6J8A398_MYTCO|nr:unnamed protein product [Mytilus coruscus]
MFETDSYPSTSEQADLSQVNFLTHYFHSSNNGCNIQPTENETENIQIDDLTESYGKAESWQLKRQILSVLSKTLSFQGMSQKIQGITEYRYYIAKKHSSVYGCALPSPNTEHHRQKMDPPKLDIFLDFITSSHIIKDLPFGDKMRLSSGKITETHNQLNSELLASLNSLIANSDLKEKEDCRDDYQYKLSQAHTNIFSWKTHILRTCYQERAKTEIMNTMGQNDILIVLDWAMKFLPQRYREDQSNWFAKRGLSWHTGVAFRRIKVVESSAFNHIFNGQIPQDSYATSAVILDIVNELKEQDNSKDKVHLWSDNAGCYKSSDTIYALYCSKSVTSYDFCEAQSGKGACDRTAATLKSSIMRYINQGNDVLTATQMKEAIEKTSKKKAHYVVKVVETDSSAAQSHQKVQIPSISAMNNFEFVKNGVKVWRHYKLGAGILEMNNKRQTITIP